MEARQLAEGRVGLAVEGRFDPGPRFLVDLVRQVWARAGGRTRATVGAVVAVAVALARALG